MATVTLKGSPVHTIGELPAKGTSVQVFKLVKTPPTINMENAAKA